MRRLLPFVLIVAAAGCRGTWFPYASDTSAPSENPFLDAVEWQQSKLDERERVQQERAASLAAYMASQKK